MQPAILTRLKGQLSPEAIGKEQSLDMQSKILNLVDSMINRLDLVENSGSLRHGLDGVQS
jgi:BMFP domain-containing protein YqiC